MKFQLSDAAIQSAERHLAADFREQALVELGDAAIQEKKVGPIIELVEGTHFMAGVHLRKRFSVQLFYHPETQKWSARCSCPLRDSCVHHYAVLRSLIQPATSPIPETPAKTKRGTKESETWASNLSPEIQTLGQMFQRGSGSKLSPQIKSFLSAFQDVFRHAHSRGGITAADFLALGIPITSTLMRNQIDWPVLPKDPVKFWLWMAKSIVITGGELPAFLAPISDTNPIEEEWNQHVTAREAALWQEKLAREFPGARTRNQQSLGSYQIRIRFQVSTAILEFLRPGATSFESFKNNRQFDQFVRDRGEQLVMLGPEGDLLLSVFEPLASYLSRPFELSYFDPASQRRLARILRLPLPGEMLVNEDGVPFVREPEPLQWLLTCPQQAGASYTISLVKADGSELGPVMFRLQTRPMFIATPTHLYTLPKPAPMDLADEAPVQIPAPALETAYGLALLKDLNLAVPPQLEQRLVRIPVIVTVTAKVLGGFYASSQEHCKIKITARSEDDRIHETYSSRGWHESDHDTAHSPTARKTAAKSGSEAALKIYDRSDCDRIPELLGVLNAKEEPYTRVFAVRITKQFPEQFSAWLKMLPKSVRVDLDDELASLAQAPVSGTVRLEVTETEVDWFDLRVVLNVTDTTLSPEELRLLLAARGKFVRLGKKGWRRLEFQISAEEDQKLARLGLNPRELSDEPQRLHALQLADDAAGKLLPEAQVESIRRRVQDIQTRVQPEVPSSIKAELRPYQRDGFHFLAYLSSNRFGGILADDMGLGKTLQTLTWLAWLRDQPESSSPSRPGPSLVVCPKSVMDNWQAEASRFLPDLRVRVWNAGNIETLPQNADSADLHVLNYAQLRMVGESMSETTWLALILDEGQYIKNPSSQSAQIARIMKARHRLVLSGTPIENRLMDLWSLMAFAMPGALGSRAQFAKSFDNKEDPYARKRLASRVRPFLLRRTKSQVAKDLPDKIEEDLLCSMDGEQKTLYRAELKHAQQKLLQLKTQQQLDKERFNILVSLLRLRQICCHPRLVHSDFKGDCAKLDALMDQLEPLMEEGHKVLVFSQFVELLQILQSEIEARSWKSFYLAGETEDRGKLVNDFQKHDGSAVFLISLKAGGFGLNLTSAHYVVLFDPWWNPAVENQAIDRTHRIGQTQKVIAYRLLIKDSVEEKIRALQRRKSALAEDVLGEERFSQSLSLSDLQFLFAD